MNDGFVALNSVLEASLSVIFIVFVVYNCCLFCTCINTLNKALSLKGYFVTELLCSYCDALK